MQKLVWVLVVALIVLHQDCWNWQNGNLIFGFLPVGLAYHIVLSIAASAVWLLAVQYAWPDHLDADDAATAEAPAEGAGE
ncbi:MAG: hypothetical protein CMJ78_09200 [Planctomycetaceae bacterium]|nr:hypothetical protein [Planctomycetaceae bacterium]